MPKEEKKVFLDVTVDLPVDGLFTYSLKGEVAPDELFGRRVLVPFGRRKVTGYVVGVKAGTELTRVKSVIEVLDDAPLFDEARLKCFKLIASYYFAPLGEVLSLSHPSSINIKSKKLIRPTSSGEEFARTALSGVERDIILAAAGGVTLSLLSKRLKGFSVGSAVKKLVGDGLLVEEDSLSGAGGRRMERFISLKDGIDWEETISSLKGSPKQAEILRYLVKIADETDTSPPPLKVEELFASIGVTPAPLKGLIEKGFVTEERRERVLDALSGAPARSAAHHTPTPEQAKATRAVSSALNEGGYKPFLLYGVTGSGKTLVYLKCIEEAVSLGKRAIVLVPEIALTPVASEYLTEAFPGRVAIIHSGLTESERYFQWRRIYGGEADIVIGTRSALFSPLKDLGLIIVDEEHDTSYKQEEGVKYNAKDAALILAKTLGITVMLASATPSVESFYNQTQGKLKLLTLTKRVMEREMPPVELVDMKGVKKGEDESGGGSLSERLVSLLGETLLRKEQALIFLNRRGFSNFVICKDCGAAPECVNCSVTLTLHKGPGLLRCHYCDYSITVPDTCPVCKGVNLESPGIGTEKVEEEIKTLFPEANIARLDRDTTRKRGEAKKILRAMDSGEVDFLIGTQMVSKGHDFPGITLVGVISGDTSLNIPDFRGAERTFQLIAQASGRAGRGALPAKVIIQTVNPDHFCFTAALKHDYDAFYAEEILEREAVWYPPFSKLSVIRIDGPLEAAVSSGAMELKRISDTLTRNSNFTGVRVLGPVPALIGRLKGRHRWQLLIKAGSAVVLNGFIRDLKGRFDSKGKKGVNVSIDIDPLITV